MSYLVTAPEALAAASGHLALIGDAVKEAAIAAAPSTEGIAAAAADEVSLAVAQLFGSHAQEFQALTARIMLLQNGFERLLSASGAAYAFAEAANMVPLQSISLARASLGAVLNSATNAVGLGGVLHFPSTVAVAGIDGVTGVEIGFSFLRIPIGGSVLGIPYGYEWPAPAFWYFPTQADGAVNANGTVYLAHGFSAIGWFYQPLAIELAQQTNSVVVTPTVPSLPLPFGPGIFSGELHQGVASLFLGDQTALNISAQAAGYQGTLPEKFVLTGHSAGGGVAVTAAGDYVAAIGSNLAANNLLGVVLFDGGDINFLHFAASVTNLQAAGIPLYTVTAPPQLFNGFGIPTNYLVSMYPGQFVGVEIVGGSHIDPMLGAKPVIDFVSQLITGFSPPGATAAIYILATGWINDFYAGGGPTNPIYGIYGSAGQHIALGPATGIVLPAR
ncbi:PE family protein [Mycobacterium intermedium]|uniref:PE family protein n=1 Tax=Mycobacterium intermedium TaxID=28445 RepID=A0A1E3SLN3_MYCIE|nr:PE family protein [Mycobacterium intermedium]MCV6964801.1 PE family protein [Mycobacterium intermedium]ODR03031.1 PE-PGRS family protein [Mycobacterium intermedium]OPE45630.1 PE family protein [Mycobacterium intermedium]ORB02376.1 PE family protein [Mycobacterium intermedium]